VKRFSCLRQSQPVSAFIRWLGVQTADSDCDLLKKLKRFTTVIVFWQFRNSFETVLFQFYFSCDDSLQRFSEPHMQNSTAGDRPARLNASALPVYTGGRNKRR